MASDKIKNLQALYEKEYVEKFEKDQSPIRISRLMRYIHLPGDSHVADFGCGNGMLLDCIHDKVGFYSGVDFSEHFILAARTRQRKSGISNAEFYCESIVSFCLDNGEKFDAGFILDLAEHVYDQEWAKILTAIYGALKPGGKLYLHTPNAEFFLERMKKNNFVFHQFKEHIAVRDTSHNTRMLEDAGFSHYEVKLLPHYNILRFFHFLSFLPIIGKYFKARIFIIAEKKK